MDSSFGFREPPKYSQTPILYSWRQSRFLDQALDIWQAAIPDRTRSMVVVVLMAVVVVMVVVSSPWVRSRKGGILIPIAPEQIYMNLCGSLTVTQDNFRPQVKLVPNAQAL
jgi:hypothetical protein